MDDAQRTATEIALSVLSRDRFILAGGQALAEHGVIDRMSEDIDLFAQYCNHRPETFAASVKKIRDMSEHNGYNVETTRQYEEFASLTVTKNGTAVVINLGLDWWENKPAIVDVGPVCPWKIPSHPNFSLCTPAATPGTISTRTPSLPARTSPRTN